MDSIIQDVAVGLTQCFNNQSAIVFPQYRTTDEFRVSEQESKILFAHEFLKRNIRFAIEAPTKSPHTQTGTTPKSARFDLVTYKEKSFDFAWAIELKAHNAPAEYFRKDFEKMALTDSSCVWFHTLKNADKGTYTALIKKINAGLKKEIAHFKGKHIWKFAVVVLEQRTLYVKDLHLEKGKYTEITDMTDFKKIDLLNN